MKKKGFVFIETIAMLIVVTVSLSILLLSYSLIVRNTNAKKYYDKVPDKYMLYSIYYLGLDNTTTEFLIDNVKNDSNYNTLKEKTGLVDIYFVNNVDDTLKDAIENKIKNGAIEYMKTLKKCNLLIDNNCIKNKNYLVGVFKKSDNYYYASIEI